MAKSGESKLTQISIRIETDALRDAIRTAIGDKSASNWVLSLVCEKLGQPIPQAKKPGRAAKYAGMTAQEIKDAKKAEREAAKQIVADAAAIKAEAVALAQSVKREDGSFDVSKLNRAQLEALLGKIAAS